MKYMFVPFCFALVACEQDKGITQYNSNPEVTITSHQDGDALPVGEMILFRASASDPNDGSEQLIGTWYAGSTAICSDVVPDNTGKEVAFWLEKAGMIANHNGIPKDPRPPMQTSGIRLGTPAVTTRNMGVKEMEKIAEWIDRVIVSKGDSKVQEEVKNEISTFCSSFPLPH